MRTFPNWMPGILLALLLVGAVPFALGCSDDGPMEELGENLDDAADEVEDEVD